MKGWARSSDTTSAAVVHMREASDARIVQCETTLTLSIHISDSLGHAERQICSWEDMASVYLFLVSCAGL